MTIPIRPEDILPGGQNTAVVNGRPVRKGTAAAFLANLKALQALPQGSTDGDALLQDLRAAVPTLRDLGLFDLFVFRSAEMAELLGVTT